MDIIVAILIILTLIAWIDNRYDFINERNVRRIVTKFLTILKKAPKDKDDKSSAPIPMKFSIKQLWNTHWRIRVTLTHKILLGLLLFLLLFTNPNPSDFKTFLQGKGQSYSEKRIGREYNFLLFSIYTNNTFIYDQPIKIKYIGIFKNFYPL